MATKTSYGVVYDRATKYIDALKQRIDNLGREKTKVMNTGVGRLVIDINNEIMFIQQRINVVEELKNKLKFHYHLLKNLRKELEAFYSKYNGVHESIGGILAAFENSIVAVENTIIQTENEIQTFLPSVINYSLEQ